MYKLLNLTFPHRRNLMPGATVNFSCVRVYLSTVRGIDTHKIYWCFPVVQRPMTVSEDRKGGLVNHGGRGGESELHLAENELGIGIQNPRD